MTATGEVSIPVILVLLALLALAFLVAWLDRDTGDDRK